MDVGNLGLRLRSAEFDTCLFIVVSFLQTRDYVNCIKIKKIAQRENGEGTSKIKTTARLIQRLKFKTSNSSD